MAGFLVAASDHQQDKATEDFEIQDFDTKNVQGTWVVVSVERGRQKPQEVPGMKVVFKDDKCLIQDPGQVTEGRFRLNPNKSPKWIDITFSREGFNNRVSHGIYALNGDVLKLCGAGPDEPRPSEFISTVGTSLDIWVFKREKP
jgi:uncharacterized protein (TIGR03067 family)